MTAVAADPRESVGPYRIVKAIGAGGSARIDLATIDRAYGFQRHVVVKRPLEHLRGHAATAAMLRREARLGGMLQHPHLVAVLDAGEHAGYDYLVLEYVEGAALRALVEGEAPGRIRALPLAFALACVRDAARGLHHAHELVDERGDSLGLVHRDVSPGNVLVGLDGAIKLADFGIAKETHVHTLSGSMHGTVTYMAPEMCRGHAFDRRADIFSLGVILHELVTGSRLFWADNDVASLHKVLSGSVPRPRSLRPDLPPALDDIIMTALATDPEKRFASAKAMADAIDQLAATTGDILAARSIARAIGALVPTRQTVPRMSTAMTAEPFDGPTVVERERSLVELIAATPAVVELPTFGEPHVPGEADEVVGAPPRPIAPARSRRTLVASLGLAAILAGAGAAVVVGGSRDDVAITPPADTAASDIAAPAPLPSERVEPAVEPAAVESVPPPEPDPDPVVAVPASPPQRKRPRNRVTPPPVVATPKPPVAQPAQPKGSGAKVEWNPNLLLPTDRKR